MSYLVLARKYRPQTFDEIVGQEHVTRTLQNAFARGRVHHAFLFCGARGVGKTTAARVLAKSLCCEKGIGQACGVCSACLTITDGTAVDYHEIDGASNNGVDDIRELRDGVRYQPAQLRRKIYVIDEVHMLSVAAFNALLKTLEEPPPHVTFIFATTEVHKIPVTILSRCQRYDFKLVPTQRLAQHLGSILEQEKISVDKGALGLLAREAGGSVRDSLSLTDQVIAYVGGEAITEAKVAEVLGVADRALLVDLLTAVVAGDAAGALGAVHAAADRGVDLAHLARTFLALLRDAAVVTEIKDPSGLVDLSADEIAALRRAAPPEHTPRGHLTSLFDRFARACEEMGKSTSPRLVLEVALLDMASTEPLVPLAELVDRMADLEKRLRGGGGSGGGPSAGPAPAGRPPVRGAATGGVAAAPAAAPVAAAAAVAAPVAAAAAVAAPAAAPATAAAPVAAVTPSPAPPAPSAAPTRQAPADTMGAWEKVITGLEQRSISLAGLYSHARLLDWNDRAVELGFEKGSFQAQSGADSDNVGKLKAFLAETVGAFDVVVKAIAHMPAPATAATAAGSTATSTATATASTSGAPDTSTSTATTTTTTAAPGGSSVAELEADRRRVERDRRESEARQHPLTKAAIDTFGATIKEIKTDG